MAIAGAFVCWQGNLGFSFDIMDCFDQMIYVKMGCGSFEWLCSIAYASFFC